MESELVGGFFTEHSSVPFVFFFLSEYSSIVLFSTLTSVLFLGGYKLTILDSLLNIFNSMPNIFISSTHTLTGVSETTFLSFNFNSLSMLIIILIHAIIIGLKASLGAAGFVLARATLPRLPYAGLINICWLKMLPLLFGLILFLLAILSVDFLIYDLFFLY